MNKILKISLYFLLIVIVLIITYLGGGYIINRYFVKDTKNIQNDEYVIEPFLNESKGFITAGKNNEWKLRVFQAIVDEYIERDGQRLLSVSYIKIDGSKLYTVPVLIGFEKDKVPKSKFDAIKEDKSSGEMFSKRFVDSVGFFISYGESLDRVETPEQFYEYEKFKNTFTKGTAISFAVLTEAPIIENLTSELCMLNGSYICKVTELTNKYSQNLELFWNYSPDYEGTLVPYEIYLGFTPSL